jgi:hypothetical protein
MQALSNLSDAALLRELHVLAGSHRRVTAELITHLGEVDARRLHVDKGFSSLFGYCVEELSFSEDEACRRIDAARVARRFPAVLPLLETGAVTLTVLGLLKPHLTEGNHQALLARVSGASVRQAKDQVAALFPMPDVPSSIRVKLTASRALRDKLELARGSMRHANPEGDLAVVIERAVDLLIAELDKKQKGRTSRPRQKQRPARETHVTRSARREVVARDGWRCSFVADDGRRCDARAFLEFDHETPRGRGGGSEPDNLRVLCRAHNRLAAERVYGKERIALAISARREMPYLSRRGYGAPT